MEISARAFQRIFTCKIWLRYSRERAHLISLHLIRPWSFNFHRALQPDRADAWHDFISTGESFFEVKEAGP